MIPLKIQREKKEQVISSLQEYAYNQLDIEMGNLAAEQLLDWVTGEMGSFIYNQALKDARKLIEERLLTLEDDFYSLEKPLLKKK